MALHTTNGTGSTWVRSASAGRREPACARVLALTAALGQLLCLGACQAAGGPTPYFYGEGKACVEPAAVVTSLEGSLAPLQAAFDACADVPRIVVLMPHMGCERGAAILRREVLDAHPDAGLRLMVIWQDTARAGGQVAAARACAYLDDPRVIAFYDGSGIAGRAFARGNLPIAEAREVFLFYPAGLVWPSDGSRPRSARPVASAPPQTETWVHQIGRVAPERFCTPEELPGAIRGTVDRLLEDAAIREAQREDEAPLRKVVPLADLATPDRPRGADGSTASGHSD